MAAYYNENDPFAAAWLRELIKAGLIADGEVDERSIVDVRPDDLRGFVQCHFFAGIGGWSYALRLAGWPDDREVWTGSCPCQPFSSAGAQAGGHDPRDLWPVWFQLVAECRPYVVFGEQVEAAIGHGWLDRLCDDLEAEDYAVGAVGLPGPCVGAFDIRGRLWFVADADYQSQQSCYGGSGSQGMGAAWHGGDGSRRSGAFSTLADGSGQRRQRTGRIGESDRRQTSQAGRLCAVGELGDAGGQRLEEQRGQRSAPRSQEATDAREAAIGAGASVGELADTDKWRCEGPHVSVRPTRQGETTAFERRASFWSTTDWIPCADGKARPVEPGTFPLAHGVSARVGRLRGYGNAIKPPLAAVFIKAYRETLDEDLHGL